MDFKRRCWYTIDDAIKKIKKWLSDIFETPNGCIGGSWSSIDWGHNLTYTLNQTFITDNPINIISKAFPILIDYPNFARNSTISSLHVINSNSFKNYKLFCIKKTYKIQKWKGVFMQVYESTTNHWWKLINPPIQLKVENLYRIKTVTLHGLLYVLFSNLFSGEGIFFLATTI